MTGSISGQSRRRDSLSGSEEFIIDRKNNPGVKPGDKDVVVHTMYNVTTEDNRAEQSADEWDAKGGDTKTLAYKGSDAV